MVKQRGKMRVLIGFIMILVVVIYVIFTNNLFPLSSLNKTVETKNGLTAEESSNAINLTKDDKDLNDFINYYDITNTVIDNISLIDYDVSTGFINNSHKIALVRLTSTTGYFFDRLEYVDLNTNKIVGNETRFLEPIPVQMYVIIPPGASWYHTISGIQSTSIGYTTLSFNIFVNITSTDSVGVYAYIVDKTNLENLKHNHTFSATTLLNSTMNTSYQINGNELITNSWDIGTNVQYNTTGNTINNSRTENTYYIILKNSDQNKEAYLYVFM